MEVVREQTEETKVALPKNFESKKKVSICMLTMERYVMTKYVFETLISFVGEDIDVELLVLDNASKDTRIVDYFKDIADVHIVESENIGVAKGFNKLFRKCTGDYICLIGNDIVVHKNWLNDLIYYADLIDNSGICAIFCEGIRGYFTPLMSVNDTLVNIWKRNDNTIDGLQLFRKEILEKIGGYDETFGKYGYEDNQFALRCAYSGYHNFYIPNQFSTHIGRDINETSNYRKEKDLALQISQLRFVETLREMKKSKNYFISL